jgi:hypothetical protein
MTIVIDDWPYETNSGERLIDVSNRAGMERCRFRDFRDEPPHRVRFPNCWSCLEGSAAKIIDGAWP